MIFFQYTDTAQLQLQILDQRERMLESHPDQQQLPQESTARADIENDETRNNNKAFYGIEADSVQKHGGVAIKDQKLEGNIF